MAYDNLVCVAAVLSDYVLRLEDQIANNVNYQWLINADGHPDAENCASLDDVSSDGVSFENWEEYKNTIGPIYQADHPDEFAEWSKIPRTNTNYNPTAAEYYADTVDDLANEYGQITQNLSWQWQNLRHVLECFKDGRDLPLSEIIDEINVEEGYANFWEESEFVINPDCKARAAAFTIFTQLVEEEEIDADTVQITMLGRWSKGEDMVYIKLDC
jgi:hypothetical protein